MLVFLRYQRTAFYCFCMNTRYLLATLLLVVTSSHLVAQRIADRPSPVSISSTYAATASQNHQQIFSADTSTINKRRLTWTIIGESAFYAAGMGYLGLIWYKDIDRVPFTFFNDNAGYLQIDKLGHAYGAYLESYIGYKALRAAGVKKVPALWYGGTLGLVLQTPIEVFDGLHEGWGFSWGDMVANTAGTVLLMGQEALFDEQILRYKFSFFRSPYADTAGGYLGDNFLESFFYDYNGHSYWLSMNANRLLPGSPLPDWVNIAVGYSANGMYGEFENRSRWGTTIIPETSRDRQFLLSMDIDWTKIPTHSKVLKAVFEGLNFVKIPFPALEVNSQGQFRGYWIYF